jgi:hypothetical protein
VFHTSATWLFVLGRRLIYDIRSTELFISLFKHVRQLIPNRNIGPDEDGSWLSIFAVVFIDQLLSLWSQANVCDEDIAVL